MLVILTIATVLFFISLYLIFLKPRGELHLASPATTEEELSLGTEPAPSAAPSPPASVRDEKLYRELHKELANKIEQLEKLETDIVKIKEEKDMQIASLEVKADELDTTLNKKNLDINEKQKSLNEFQAKITGEKEAKEKIMAEFDELDVLVKNKDLELGKKDAVIDNLNQQLNKANEELKKIHDLQFEAVSHKDEIEGYKKKLFEKEKQLSDLGGELEKKEAVLAKFSAKKTVAYSRAFKITRGLREKLRKHERETGELRRIAGENKKIKARISESALDKEESLQKKDVLAVELRNKLNGLNEKYVFETERNRMEIDNLKREAKVKDKIIKDLKSEYKKDVSVTDEGKLKKDFEGVKAEYSDLKDKSNWLVKLIREETEKNKKLTEEINDLKTEKKETPQVEVPEGVVDKELEYFLKIYQDNLDKVFVDERNMPENYEEIKTLYLNLKRHSQYIARQLREAMDKIYELSCDISKLRKEEDQEEK